MAGRDKWRHYRSVVLRFWQEESADDASGWRFSVEDPHTGERRAFAGIERLVAYLRDQITREAAGEDQPPTE